MAMSYGPPRKQGRLEYQGMVAALPQKIDQSLPEDQSLTLKYRALKSEKNIDEAVLIR